MIYFLDNNEIEIDNFTFLCPTLWTDMGNMNADVVTEAVLGLNDFQVIEFDNRLLEPADTFNMFKNSLGWLKNRLKKLNSSKTIVISHHLPSFKSVAPQFEGSILNHCFASNLDFLFERYNLPL